MAHVHLKKTEAERDCSMLKNMWDYPLVLQQKKLEQLQAQLFRFHQLIENKLGESLYKDYKGLPPIGESLPPAFNKDVLSKLGLHHHESLPLDF